MSGAISDDMLDDGMVNTLAIHGQTIVILSGLDLGKSFVAKLETKPDAEISGEVVKDSREKVMVSFANDSFPARTKPKDTFRDAKGTVWQFVSHRTNNPADNSVDFEAKKVVAGKDN